MKRCWVTFLPSWTHNWWSLLDHLPLFYALESFSNFDEVVLFFLPPCRSRGHWFTDMPLVAAYIWLAWKKSERSLIPNREEKMGFKVVYLLPVTEDVGNEAMQREELLLMWKTRLDMGLLCVTLIIPGSRSVYHAACLYRKITWGVGSFFSSCFQPC